MFIATKNYLIAAQVMSDSYVAHDLTNRVSAFIYKDFAPTVLSSGQKTTNSQCRI